MWWIVAKICRLFLRYHYNVADSRLSQHIEKGNEDGLYISCVSSSANLWALIMDAGTGFCSQVYELSPVFLHKVQYHVTQAWLYWMNALVKKPNSVSIQDWIMEQWEKSYYITAIAGSTNGSSLVVMSKGMKVTIFCCYRAYGLNFDFRPFSH